jgi:hypothetical protein
MVLRCEGRLEFVSQPGGSTEVCIEHDHMLTGGNWGTRRSIRVSDPTNEDRLFREMITRCQAALHAKNRRLANPAQDLS